MVETIAPVVYGTRARWRSAIALHALGATLSAAAFGAALGGLGSILDAPFGRAGLVSIVLVAVVYAIGESPRVELPVPQWRRQVPDWWRTFFAWPASTFLYGLGLGVGFATYLAHGTLVVVAAVAIASGDPLAGAAIVGPFGLARGMSSVAGSRVRDAETGNDAATGSELVDRLVERPPWRRAAANAAAQAATAAAAAWAVPRTTGGWAELAAALLVLSFAWAAISKVLAPRRWRAAIAAVGVPASLRPTVGWLVPAAEAVVVLAGLLGLHRLAAGSALALLAGFSAALGMRRLRGERRLTCGCFGGSRDVHVGAALARNAALGAAAVLSLGVPDAAIRWPGWPSGGDLLPAALAAMGLAAALALALAFFRALRRAA